VTKRTALVSSLVMGFSLMTAAARAAEVKCAVDQVSMLGGRIHVRCAGLAPIAYFALPITSPSALSLQLMGQLVFIDNVKDPYDPNSVAASGAALKVGGASGGTSVSKGLLRTMTIRYDENDTSGASFGCAPSDCRKPTAFFIFR
jgi:hypothetical protein